MLFKLLLPFAFGYFLSFLYRVVNVAIAPDLVQEFGLDANQMGLISSAYLLTFASVSYTHLTLPTSDLV